MQQVIVYTSTTCAHCHTVKEYLQEKGIQYEEKNITTDKKAKRDLILKKILAVPVVMYGDNIIMGFDKEKMDELFK